jgi:hypothetical protein
MSDAFLAVLPKPAPIFRLRPRNARTRREKAPCFRRKISQKSAGSEIFDRLQATPVKALLRRCVYAGKPDEVSVSNAWSACGIGALSISRKYQP